MGFDVREMIRRWCLLGCGEAARQLSLSMGLIGLDTANCRAVVDCQKQRRHTGRKLAAREAKSSLHGKWSWRGEQRNTPAYPSPKWPPSHFSVFLAFLFAFSQRVGKFLIIQRENARSRVGRMQ